MPEVQPFKVTKMCPVSRLLRLHNLQRKSDWRLAEPCHTQVALFPPRALAACPRYVQSHFSGVGGAKSEKVSFTVNQHDICGGVTCTSGTFFQTTSYRVRTRRSSAQIMQETHLIRSFLSMLTSSFFFFPPYNCGTYLDPYETRAFGVFGFCVKL